MDIFRKLAFAVLLSIPFALFAAQAVNINTADKETLMSIKGIGEKRAEAIIAYREQYGPFKSVEQLLEVQGVGNAILDENRDNLTITDSE
ncbi:MAG: ComEA family DNA-binding protein [Gammaproteobacteria bacterium]|nr:ComEA family DNA-binding protein [Gammaproteobacteria bacterium]